jgi:23S rRNA (adenine2503-C2)-methyltransferase
VTPFAPIVRRRREGGLVKFAQRLADGALIESVIVPMREKEPGKARTTLCMSTQAGCRMGCVFCATGRMGLLRNLSPEEICGQIAAAESLGSRPENLVFMGMGEPLDNFENLVAAIRRLIESRPARGERPLAYSTRQMIVSTCGLVPGIERLAAAGWKRLVLAVSLNAPNDAIRSRLMPVNRRYPMAALRQALLAYPLRGRVFMAEYVLFRGVNDRREHAEELAEYLRPFRACVNLIAWNPVREPGSPGVAGSAAGFESPTAAEVERFKRWLNTCGQYARRREAKGRRIGAGCGQLAGMKAEGRRQKEED